MRKGKVKIYLKSGSVITIKCLGCEFTVNRDTGDYTGYNIQSPDSSFGIDVRQIEAWEYIK